MRLVLESMAGLDDGSAGEKALLGELVCKADHVTFADAQGVRPNEGLTQQDGQRSYSAQGPPRRA